MANYVLAVLVVITSLTRLCAQQTLSIASQNRSIVLTVRNTPTGAVTYQLSCKGKSVLDPSDLGFKLSKPTVSLTQFPITAVDSSTTDADLPENYEKYLDAFQFIRDVPVD